MGSTYPIARFRLDFEVTSPLRLPEYAGSTLRGAFGHALRQLGCVTRAKECNGCMLLQNCPYISVFEPLPQPQPSLKSITTVPVPYIIEPPEWGARDYSQGEILSFGFTLIGRAQVQLPLCIMSWQRAFARGVGAGDGTAELLGVSWVDGEGHANLIHQPGGSLERYPLELTLPDFDLKDSVTLHFDTPLRLQLNGHALPPSKLGPRSLLTALARRISLLSEMHAAGPYFTAEQFTLLGQSADRIGGSHDMAWRDWTRRSSRQQRTMQLGGCTGSWTLEGDLSPFKDILQIGQWLHVGKEASFGLGRYRIAAG